MTDVSRAAGRPIGPAELALLRAASWAIAVVPAGSGQGVLARPIYFRRLEGRPEREADARLRGGVRARLDLADRLQAISFLTRDYDPAMLKFILGRLRDGGDFVDVGAHVGLVSLSVAARAGRQAKVHAFEPDPANADAFRRNLSMNPRLEPQVTLNEAAVGPAAGTVRLWRAPSASDRALGRVAAGEAPTGQEPVEVPQVTLDDYLDQRKVEHVAVMKMDIEGYEPAALEGAGRSLAEGRIGCVVLEMNGELLAENGWTPETVISALGRNGLERMRIPPVGLRRLSPREEAPVEDVAFVRS